MKRSKKYNEAVKNIDKDARYMIDEAITKIKEVAYANFDETIDIYLKLNISKGVSIRDIVALEHQFGKEKKILVFAKGDKADEAKKAGATYVGDADLIEKIKGGWIDFDVAIATPDMMKDVGKLGPLLGRRGLMPNPKSQTVTFDIKGAIEELKKGRKEFRADKTGVVHLPIGKISMETEKIKANAEVVINEIKRKKPADLKGDFIKSVALSSTMGPAFRLSLRDILS